MILGVMGINEFDVEGNAYRSIIERDPTGFAT